MIPTIQARGFWDDEGNACTPNPHQAWAMRAVVSEEITELFCFGGFGSGKTVLGANALMLGLTHALQDWNGKATSKARFGLGGSDGTQLRTVTRPAFEAVFNAATGWDGPFWASKRVHNPLVLGYSRDDRAWELPWARIVEGTGHNGCASWEGQKFVGAVGDETPLWMQIGIDRAIRRHRQTGYPARFRLFPATPQPGRSMWWIKERYQDLEPYGVRGGLCRIMMPTEANAANLPPDYIDQLRASVSPAMAKAILYGELVTIEGRVYPDYGAENVTEYEYDPQRPVYLGWDPGFHRSAIVAAQQHGDLDIIFDEIILADSSIEAQAREVLAKPWAGNIHTIVHDRAAKAIRAAGGTSELAEFKKVLRGAGLEPAYAYPRGVDDVSIAVGVERVRSRIQAADGERRAMVAREVAERRYRAGNDGRPCSGIHRTFTEQTMKPGGDEPDRPKELDHLSHAGDAWRYLNAWMHPVKRIDRTAVRAFLASNRQRLAGAGGASEKSDDGDKGRKRTRSRAKVRVIPDM